MEAILAALVAVALLWLLYRGVKMNKETFSKENLNMSLRTLGFLGLILIALVAFAVFMLRK